MSFQTIVEIKDELNNQQPLRHLTRHSRPTRQKVKHDGQARRRVNKLTG